MELMGSFLRPRRHTTGQPVPGSDAPAGPGATDGGGAASSGMGSGGAGEAAVDTRPTTARAVSVLAGFREPIVPILLAIAFFTAISGKPVDGVLMLIVALSLAWDAASRARAGPEAASAEPAPARPRPEVHGLRRFLLVAGLITGGGLYAAVVGSFTRYSWPATAAIIGLGTVVVLIGWQGPLPRDSRRRRTARDRLPVLGTVLWGAVFVFGGVWELVALLKQPTLITDSYAHPTISTLTDPVLVSAAGRSSVLAAWLLLGWYLARR